MRSSKGFASWLASCMGSWLLFVLTSSSVVYHFASRASRFPDDNLKQRPTNLAQIEQRSTQKFIEKYGKLPERDENDFYLPLQIIDGSPNRI